jgi:hypothetical protein
VTWGLYCQAHRLGRSATMLADHGMDQEGRVLVRVMPEHTIMLHWIVERGDDRIDAMHANQSKQMTRTFDRARVVSFARTGFSRAETKDFIVGTRPAPLERALGEETERRHCAQARADTAARLIAVYWHGHG